ncbi:hypothetical protein KPP03845_104078 [Streptomyces xanthophaeus]|uniref:hypothetical protein n=1 Tax=Streptomyces xanthophaeus TaxID=67385 RepID=UPI00233E6921|nr:hypothetical protein [Streptomyces xanthophaeus]WCD87681.1 hypothetical protein KPP03845_104078 [Streptomyces xanthophaeus]
MAGRCRESGEEATGPVAVVLPDGRLYGDVELLVPEGGRPDRCPVGAFDDGLMGLLA